MFQLQKKTIPLARSKRSPAPHGFARLNLDHLKRFQVCVNNLVTIANLSFLGTVVLQSPVDHSQQFMTDLVRWVFGDHLLGYGFGFLVLFSF